MKKSDFKKHTSELPNGDKITFYHNLPEAWGLNIDAAIVNWFFRTENYSVESLAKYVGSKGVDHKIITEEEYNKLK